MKIRNRNSGQSLVEFALIFPLVFLLITGFLDMGRAIYTYSSISNAVREGTRFASVNKEELKNGTADTPDYSIIINKVISFSFGVNLTQNQVSVVITKDPNGYFNEISITATYMFKPITPGIKQIFGTKTGIPITAQSTMRVAPGSR